MKTQLGFNKQNRFSLERRLSLKPSLSTTNTNSKSCLRMSIPSRRESISINSLFGDGSNGAILKNNNNNRNKQNNIISMQGMPFRDSLRQARPSFASCMSVQLPVSNQNKKEVILSNLVKKLDHEQQLKQIIQSKIKNNSRGCEFSRCSYEPTEEIYVKFINCQKQLDCFKDIVKSLMQKISQLEKNPSDLKPITKEAYTQTEIGTTNFDTSRDFMQNLDKTLKILSGKKSK